MSGPDRRTGWARLRQRLGADRPTATGRNPLPERLPPKVVVDLDRPAIELWRSRAEQGIFETYAGLPCGKLPEDLRIYEHLLWLENVEVVVELGAFAGGSTLWFRDRLRTLAAYGRIGEPRVIAIDTEIEVAERGLAQADPGRGDEIVLLEGSVTDEGLARRVAELVAPGASCLVIEDTAHIYETTAASLRNYSELVQPGGFFIVEDGGVDIEELRIHPELPRGVLPAVRDWLGSEQGAAFSQRRDLELYGLGCQPEGILQRRPAAG